MNLYSDDKSLMQLLDTLDENPYAAPKIIFNLYEDILVLKEKLKEITVEKD